MGGSRSAVGCVCVCVCVWGGGWRWLNTHKWAERREKGKGHFSELTIQMGVDEKKFNNYKLRLTCAQFTSAPTFLCSLWIKIQFCHKPEGQTF